MRTENDSLRHTLAQRAKQRGTSHLRSNHPDEFDNLLTQERAKAPGAGRSITYRRAEQALRKAHQSEYSVWYVIHLERLYQEHGYEPAKVHRRSIEVEVVARSLEVLLTYAKGEVEHRNMGSCPDGIEGPDVRDPDCEVCCALNEVDFDVHPHEDVS